MKKIQINDIVEIKSLNRKGRVVNILGASYEIQIGKGFFVFGEKHLKIEEGLSSFLRSLI